MTPLQNLIKNNMYKDVDRNFADAVEAIVYLSGSQDVFGETIKLNMQGENNKTDQLYNFTDFIVFKLVENLRRMYAVGKKYKVHYTTSKKTTSSDDLMVQQNIIYGMLQTYKDKLHFDVKDKVYPRAFLRHDVNCCAWDMLCLLGMNEFISGDNRVIHFNVLQQHKTSFISKDIVTRIKSLSYATNMYACAQQLLSYISPQDLKDSFEQENGMRTSGTFAINAAQYMLDNNMVLKKKGQQNLLNRVISSRNFDDLCEDDFNKYRIYVEGATKDADYEAVIGKNISIENLFKTNSGKMIGDNIKELTSPSLFCSSIVYVNDARLLSTILQKFVINEDFYLQCVHHMHDNMNLKYELDRLNKLLQNITVSNEVITTLIGLNIDYMAVVKPYYLKNRMEAELPVHQNNTAPMRNKI